MKNYKQILEAVNRGIKFALDDFDDEEQVQNIKSKQVQNRDYTKEYLDLMNEVVDLGLPSGTLWCKYNLGVDPKKYSLNMIPNWYGDFYAWGETKVKSIYDWETYTMSEDGPVYQLMAKYTTNVNDSINHPDGLTELLPEDDAATQHMHCHNFKFHIPTIQQVQELIDNTNYEWTSHYNDIQGLNGGIFMSKINGNHIFIPAAGEKDPEEQYSGMDIGCIWVSTLHDNNTFAYQLFFKPYEYYKTCDNRCNGCSIRPVINL